jgi:hypothetical protein
MFNTLSGIVVLVSTVATPAAIAVPAVPAVVLATHSFSMEDRYDNKFVNDVFKDNILLTLNYMDGAVKSKDDINWNKIESPFHYEFTLSPGEEFAFHNNTLPDYSKNVVKTTGVDFDSTEGFKYDGDLVGDGVCHLASIIYWAAKDAGLNAYAPSNHNFAVIPDVPKEYGVAIQSPMPLGNLYVIDNLNKPITFIFNYDGTDLSVSVTEVN